MTTKRSTDQLQLLQPLAVAPALRLDERTRRVGLAGVARARLALEEARRRRLEHEADLADARRPRRAA